jgi:hypothetical protein
MLTAIAALLFTGCEIGEDLSNCPPDQNTVLVFSYLNVPNPDPDDDDSVSFPDNIGQVTTGIFDSEGNFVLEKIMKTPQDVTLALPPGTYTAVCWGNAFHDTKIDGFAEGCNMGQGRVYHPNYNGALTYAPGNAIPTNDSLYYGKVTFTKVQYQDLRVPVLFKPAHIKLKVTVLELPNTKAETLPQDYPVIRIGNLKAAYDFDMKILGDFVDYYPQVVVDTKNKTASARCDVLRFGNDNPVTIDVIDNAGDDTALYSLDLEKFIKDNNIAIVDGEEARISIQISFVDVNDITVTLVGWESAPVTPGL